MSKKPGKNFENALMTRNQALKHFVFIFVRPWIILGLASLTRTAKRAI